ILNSTTNLILTLMEQGQTFEEAVAHTQSIGIAETDPSGDIEGWDAAIKVSALVTVLMAANLKPSAVERKGIESLDSEDIKSAAAEGKRWKLICQAERTDSGIATSVRPELLDPGDPLYSVMGTSSAVTFHSDILGPLTITESDPGPHTTAYGLLADFINAVR
ncbi:MAG: homoserine dehydrogenase, partial [Anaerolineales bacterium]|nr:homoserine dehydrogenase [Anaerolineales bacterium]